jgi:hypothetical protein
MTKIGGVKRDGLFTREFSGTRPYFIFEITKSRYQQGGRALVACGGLRGTNPLSRKTSRARSRTNEDIIHREIGDV